MHKLILMLALVGPAGSVLAAGPHRLDPLSTDEVAAAVRILRAEGKAGDRARFVQVALNEPPKDSAWDSSSRPRREALAILVREPGGPTFEAVVDLGAGGVRSWTEVGRGKPPLFPGDFATTARVVRADPRFVEAIRRRGIDDPEAVQVDAWAPGSLAGQARMARAVFFLRPRGEPSYLRPIGNLTALIDLDALRVIELIDLGAVPVPGPEPGLGVDRPRTAPAMPRASAPQAAGFERSGQEIRWRGWRLRFSLHPRDGLILHEVGIEDGGRFRPILYRGSLSEVLVPYGDPAIDWNFRNAFDEGEYGIGRFADSLEPGVDCPEGATFADAVLADEAGSPYTVPRAVAIYERDGGVLWKHAARGRAEARRGRELVVASTSTLGNYVYAFEWAFRQDGSIAVEVGLTGIMLVKAADPARPESGAFGNPVGRGVVAVHHQHFFNYRLDLDVEGPSGNRVSELNAESPPVGDTNTLGTAIVMDEADLASEAQARRSMSLATNRRWKVYKPKTGTSTGRAAGYRLVPGENALPFAMRSAPVRRRAGFLDAHFWATRFDPAELYAAGPYPNQGGEEGGLGAWTRADWSLIDQDVVIWYTMGITHTPRPEDWPVMPTHRAGFLLVPDGFFARNPALPVPDPKP